MSFNQQGIVFICRGEEGKPSLTERREMLQYAHFVVLHSAYTKVLTLHETPQLFDSFQLVIWQYQTSLGTTFPSNAA
jgi:hypothetical protein